MKLSLAILIISVFLGCSNSTSDSSNTNPLFYQQWSINYNSGFYNRNAINNNAHINPQNVFYSYSGKGVKVAVIDNGFDTTHPEIKDKIIKTISVDENGVVGSDVSPPTPISHHGTAVSGIIAAANNAIGMMGVAPEVELILVRYPTNNSLNDAVLIELFTQAVNAGAQVINCSWGTGNVSDAFRNFMSTLDVVVVFASGNDNKNMGNDESAMDSVVGVGATNRDNLRTSYSDYGKNLDIVAPGGYSLGITALDPLGSAGASNDGYIRYNEYTNGSPSYFIGTSASAPIITGVIALALQKNPYLTRREIQDLLQVATSHIGNHTPYMDDMISSSSSTSTVITGIYGLSPNSDLHVRLTSLDKNTTYGLYSVQSIGNNEWSSTVTDTLPNGNYIIELLSVGTNTIWATDSSFSINSGVSQTDKTRKKSDFYGYGKIDLDKLMGLL